MADSSADRLAVIHRHLTKDSGDKVAPKIPSSIPKKRQELLRWNGWGYEDSGFVLNNLGTEQHPKYVFTFSGSRYEIASADLPHFYDWACTTIGVHPGKKKDPQGEPSYPEPILNEGFVNGLKNTSMTFSFEGMDRLFRAHGHTLHDIALLRGGQFLRIPDVVVWPECHSHVEELVALAFKYNVAVVPIGGGTNVTGAVDCKRDEQRMIVSLDTSQMNQILWIDDGNLVAHVESGIIGKDLEDRLQKRGYTTGHEPDSYEFSSLGGWVATRASGMKKNRYGNIEDLVVALRAVTPSGEWRSSGTYPRVSTGPDMNHVMIGSEGTLGVITEVTIKIRPIPPLRKYASFVFPDFDCGVKFMRQVARDRCQPASLRLMDNQQFQFGQALRPSKGPFGLIVDGLKNFYLTRLKGLDINKICVATIVMEGTIKEVAVQEEKLNTIGLEFQGIPAGEHNGKRGYQLTFAIAYIRDIGLNYGVVAESFETSVPWDRVVNVVNNTKSRLEKECADRKFSHSFISARVTQVYDAGACIYFYFAFNYGTMSMLQAVEVYEELEIIARNEIMASGGSLSHHHGVGKIRKKWLPSILTSNAINVLHSIKNTVDPQNIMAAGNLVFD